MQKIRKGENIFLVTGGAGFIGSHLIEALKNRYPDSFIVSVDNYFTGKTANHVVGTNITYLTGETKNIAEIWKKNKLTAPKVIFHLGEYSRIVQSFTEIEKIWDFNLNGTMAIVKFAQETEAKLVYAGSSSKFGNKGRDENLSPYSWIKAKNIELIKNWKQWFGGPDYVITYFYNVYGPGHIRDGKYATVIGIFEKQYLEKKPLTVVSPGTQSRDFTHIDDIVRGIIICSEKGDGDDYQLGTGREKSILEVAKMFGRKIELIPAKKGERTAGRATSKKARGLGWEPKVKIEDYITEFVNKNK